MKYYILVGMLIDLLNHEKLTAKYLAEKYEVSTRTIYRYADILLEANIPIMTLSGSGGGIKIADDFILDKMFFTEKEYNATLNALNSMATYLPDKDLEMAQKKFLTLKHFKSEQDKYMLNSQSLVVEGGPWGDTAAYRNKLVTLNKALINQNIIRVTYINSRHERTVREIEPHTIVLKEGVWYIYAFCHFRKAFRLFKVTRILDINFTQQTFSRRPFNLDDLPTTGFKDITDPVILEFEFEPDLQAEIEEWLGVSAINGNRAKATLPFSPALIKKVLSFGSGVKVLSPKKVIEALRYELNATQKLYPV